MAAKRKSSRPPPPAQAAPSIALPSLTREEFCGLRELVSGRPELVALSVRDLLVRDGWLIVDAGAYLLTESGRAYLRGPIDPSFYEAST